MQSLGKQRYFTCHNKKQKELFGMSTKVFHIKFVGCRNEKKANVNK